MVNDPEERALAVAPAVTFEVLEVTEETPLAGLPVSVMSA